MVCRVLAVRRWDSESPTPRPVEHDLFEHMILVNQLRQSLLDTYKKTEFLGKDVRKGNGRTEQDSAAQSLGVTVMSDTLTI